MWIIIFSLLIIGLALVIVEVVFVPGTTVVGIIGVIFAGAGIIFSFRHYGNETGSYMLLGSAVVTAIALYFSFRSNAWSRFANKSAIDSKVNEGLTASVTLGDEGVALSTLKPIGNAQFKSGQFEVKSLGDYVDVGTKVTVVHIQGNQIIVKPLN
ncbi:MAG TPA: NfeD family protein [Chryseosolibacter sp.]